MGWATNEGEARIRAQNALRDAKNADANPRDIAKLQAAYDAAQAEERKGQGR